jgi:hypothetical protein
LKKTSMSWVIRARVEQVEVGFRAAELSAERERYGLDPPRSNSWP